MIYLCWILGMGGAVAFSCIVAYLVEQWEQF